MAAAPKYSTLFSCLHDELEPVGQLGRGTHYSVMRSVEWLDVTRKPLAKPEVHDFAVIWDEDHDTRVIDAIEQIYMAGLLSPIQFVGERKGMLTLVVAARFYYWSNTSLEAYTRAISDISQSLSDPWPAEVGSFDRAPGAIQMGWHQTFTAGLISDTDHRVNTYLANIDSLWRLGTKPFVITKDTPWPPIPPSVSFR